MKQKLIILAALSILGSAAQAQDVYIGAGLPGLLTLGYANPMGNNWGLRGEYAGGLNLNVDGNENGVNATGSIKANRAGAFADWFPFGGGFRLVGGVTVNDMKVTMNGVGSANTQINGYTVDTSGKMFNVELVYPSTTPYIGIGYGHQASTDKGLGFYSDFGVMFGTFNVNVNQNLTGLPKSGGGTITQADIDAQTKSMRDSVSSMSVLPSFSIGLTYRY